MARAGYDTWDQTGHGTPWASEVLPAAAPECFVAARGSAPPVDACSTAPPRLPSTAVRLGELVRDHLDFLWRNLRRVGNSPADCDEIVQEAFLVASKKLAEMRPGSERAYLLSIAMNIASTRRRSYSREVRRIDSTAESLRPVPALDPEQELEQHQARQELDAVLLSMSLDLRTVFVLFELEEMTTRAIAELLGIKEGTVASRLRRAREEFRATVHARRCPSVKLVGGKS